MINEILVEPQHIVWLPWIVNYFFFVGIAATAVFTAIFFAIKSKQPSIGELSAMTIAFICSIVAPVALTADLHQPSRILHFYTDFAWWSPMAWGAIILPLFSIAVAGYFILLLARNAKPKKAKWLTLLHYPLFQKNTLLWFFRLFSAVTAVGIIIYTVLETYQTGTRALWHNAWLLPIMLFSAWVAALGLTKWLKHILYQYQSELSRTENWLNIAIKASLIFSAISLLGLYFSNAQTQIDFAQLFNGSITAYLMVGFWLVALIFSFLTKFNYLQLIAILSFSWLVRWVLIIQAQTIDKTNVMQNPYHFDWLDTDGGLGSIAIFGLAIFVSIIVWQGVLMILGGNKNGQ